jgi:hypothetical protein
MHGKYPDTSICCTTNYAISFDGSNSTQHWRSKEKCVLKGKHTTRRYVVMSS